MIHGHVLKVSYNYHFQIETDNLHTPVLEIQYKGELLTLLGSTMPQFEQIVTGNNNIPNSTQQSMSTKLTYYADSFLT